LQKVRGGVAGTAEENRADSPYVPVQGGSNDRRAAVTILIPFPPKPTAKEDPLAYWTPVTPVRPVPDEPASRPLAALAQMYGYYSA
jgi:hypothetical protein